jgi:hypothetical protein
MHGTRICVFTSTVSMWTAGRKTTKERGATILIPSSMVDSLNPPLALAIAGRDVAGATLTPIKTAA